ncbi:MAG: hypothetical protein K2Q12_06270 [Rickettsiales bacterium]|nr:hypothetical protein [Rickettsiales bacterium]
MATTNYELTPQDREIYRDNPAFLARLEALPPLERAAAHAIASSGRGFGSSVSAVLGGRQRTTRELAAVQGDSTYQSILQGLPGGAAVRSHPTLQNIAAAASESINSRSGIRGAVGFIGHAFSRLTETGSFGEFFSSLYDMARFAITGNGPLTSAWAREYAQQNITAVAAETAVRLSDPAIGISREHHAAIVSRIMRIGQEQTGADVANTPFAQALADARVFQAPRGPVIAQPGQTVPSTAPSVSHPDVTRQMALLASVQGLSIHLPERSNTDGTPRPHPFTNVADQRARRELSGAEVLALLQNPPNAVRTRWDAQLREEFNQARLRGTASATFEQYSERELAHLTRANSPQLRQFTATLATQSNGTSPAAYLREHLERDIASGAIAAATAQRLQTLQPAVARHATPEELIADVRARGPIFQRELALERGRTGSTDATVAAVTQRLTQAAESLVITPGSNLRSTGILRPSPEDMARHYQAVASNTPTPEAVQAVTHLADATVRAQRTQFVLSEVQALRPMIEANPARFGLRPEDVPTVFALTTQGPDTPTRVARVTLSAEELAAAGIRPADLRVPQSVALAREYLTLEEARVLAAMPPALLNRLLSQDRGGEKGLDAVRAAIVSAERAAATSRTGAATQLTGIRIVEPATLSQALREVSQQVIGTSPTAPSLLDRVVPAPLREWLGVDASPVISPTPLDRALAEVVRPQGVASAEGVFTSPSASPTVVGSKSDEQPSHAIG